MVRILSIFREEQEEGKHNGHKGFNTRLKM